MRLSRTPFVMIGKVREMTKIQCNVGHCSHFSPFLIFFFVDGHQSLVRSQQKVKPIIDKLEDSDGDYDSDLDINLITRKISSHDFDIRNDESDIRNQFQLDPSVWTNPIKPLTPQKIQNAYQHNNDAMARKFPQGPPGIAPPSLAQQTNALQQFIGAAPISAQPKIMSLEEIERNLINQQQLQQHQKMMQEKLVALQQSKAAHQQQQQLTPSPPQVQQQPQGPTPQQHQQLRKMMSNPQPGPGLMFPPQHLNMNGPPPPAGFPPIPPHLQGPNLSKFNPLMTMPNHPMHMNNFHPNFGGPMPLRPGAQMPPMNRLPPHLMNLQGNPLIYQNAPTSAQFNQRLVQEIQQNHPMLNPMFQRQQQQQQQQHQYNNNNNNHHFHHQHHQRFNSNGKPEEYDEYANLMSTRDKQFLITIQLMQLNTETPYFDDYYYTMYKERQRLRGVDNESFAHRDNQLNHPFTQPKGHAHMLLRQLNTIDKNGGIQNRKNGMGRERRNSENSQKNEKEPPTPRTYTPLQFENSLGKLQCGSVTAPRKIIDMEIVGNGENGGQSTSTELSSQKKSRQILMHIETLYKIVLKLEDLQHPWAISATIILKVGQKL